LKTIKKTSYPCNSERPFPKRYDLISEPPNSSLLEGLNKG
jgi:hypothetical protein